MMFTIKLWGVCAILSAFSYEICAFTHWVVTENGKIQSQPDSIFHMRRPYDLLSLLDQEKRVKRVEKLHRELMILKSKIDQQWGTLEGAIGFESRLYSQEPDCLNAGHTLADTDLSISLLGNIRERIKLENYLISNDNGLPNLPDCTSAVDLDFSMPCFEHLQVMVQRKNLSTSPDLSLASIVLEDRDMSHFAHQIASGLQRNATSWLHHNLAAVYWRIRGNAPNAVECARRAVHFAPRQFRDLALLTLGGLLQQAKASVEAALVLHAAVDHAPHAAQNHLALGIIYTTLGDFNRSVACLDNALKLSPSLEIASKIKHTLKCYNKLERGLLDMQQSLQSMAGQLEEFNSIQDRWLQLEEHLQREQAPFKMRLLDQDPSILSLLRGPNCAQELAEGRTLSPNCEHSALTTFSWQTQTLQMLLRKVELRAKKIGDQMIQHTPFLQNHHILKPPFGAKDRVSPEITIPFMKLSPEVETKIDLEMKPDIKEESKTSEMPWPTKEECAAFSDKVPAIQDISSVFLAPEERGFEAHLYLGRLIGLDEGTEHALPWYPPTCSAADVADPGKLFPPLPPQGQAAPSPETELLPVLLEYGVQGQAVEAEIGQRILTAINKDVGPSWLLHLLAALYWRVRGNMAHAMDCLRVAVSTVPNRLKDLPLVSLGALLLRNGLLKAARKAAMEALALDETQITTHYLLSLVAEAERNHSGAIHHLKRVVEVNPNYRGGQARNLLQAIACQDRYPNSPPMEESSSEEMCGTGKPMDLLTSLEGMREGDTVVCSVDGQSCHTVQCFTPGQDIGSVTLGAATVARLLSPPNGQCSEGEPPGHPDESELERMGDPNSLPKHFRLRVALGDEDLQSSNLGEFYVPVALMDNAWLRVYDKSGTYALSPSECERIHNIDWTRETAVWLSATGGGITLGLLPRLMAGTRPVDLQPECDGSLPPSPLTLDYLTGVRLRHQLRMPPDIALQIWLASLMDQPSSSPSHLGSHLAAALQENATSWVLATAAALYWRIVGHADHAVTCLRQALQYAPSSERNIPLVSLASVLERSGFNSDALVVASMALDLAPKFFLAHFTIANIHVQMGDLEKAITFYRSSLELEPNFEPARSRLLGILCSVLFEEHRKHNQ